MNSAIRRLCHWGPLAVLGIIKLITWVMIYVVDTWWPPQGSIEGALHGALFLFLSTSTLYYFLQSLVEGPGYVPLRWKPANDVDAKHLQWCSTCNGYKPPRSHHCRKCGHCIKKMDHHCPWINCCVGHNNHAYFTKFLTFAVLGCLHASIVLSICIYHVINRVRYQRMGVREPVVLHTLTSLLTTLLALGMALGVVLAVGTLLYMQIRGIIRNRTTIEDWIVEKAEVRRREHGLPAFVFPYDLGWRRNVAAVLWKQRSDGLRWPLVPGCDQYDLTREQLAQKMDKASRARPYVATRAYSGRACAECLCAPRVALAAPCADSGLPLVTGDRLRVTRHRKYWLFGEKIIGGGEGIRGPRGWFPRSAAVPSGPEPQASIVDLTNDANKKFW